MVKNGPRPKPDSDTRWKGIGQILRAPWGSNDHAPGLRFPRSHEQCGSAPQLPDPTNSRTWANRTRAITIGPNTSPIFNATMIGQQISIPRENVPKSSGSVRAIRDSRPHVHFCTAYISCEVLSASPKHVLCLHRPPQFVLRTSLYWPPAFFYGPYILYTTTKRSPTNEALTPLHETHQGKTSKCSHQLPPLISSEQ